MKIPVHFGRGELQNVDYNTLERHARHNVGRHDYLGRRVRKQVFDWDPAANENEGAWETSPTTDLRFVYDGWNLLMELDGLNSSVGWVGLIDPPWIDQTEIVRHGRTDGAAGDHTARLPNTAICRIACAAAGGVESHPARFSGSAAKVSGGSIRLTHPTRLEANFVQAGLVGV